MSDQKPTTASQTATMRSLTQQAAAWLLGFKAVTTLRGATDCPRNGDNSYNAHDVVSWHAAREAERALSGRKPSHLSDEDRERMANLAWAISDLGAVVVSDVVTALDRVDLDHGDAGLAAAVRAFVTVAKRDVVGDFTKPTAAAIRESHARAADEEIRRLSSAVLDVVDQCSECNAIFWNGGWTKRKALPEGCVSKRAGAIGAKKSH